MNKEYIEREVVITALENTDWYSINKKGEIVLGAFSSNTALFKAEDMFALLRKVPTEDVAPVRHGEWIQRTWKTECDWGGISHRGITCSLCKVEFVDKEPTRYCPDCGAKMDMEN